MKLILCLLAAGQLSAMEVSWEALPGLAAKAPASQVQVTRAEAQRARQGSFRRSLHPRLGAFVGAGGSSGADKGDAGLEAGLGLQWNLWRGGLDQAEEASREAGSEAARAQAEATKARLLLDSREAWLEAWDLHGRSLAIKRALERAQSDIKAARQKAGAGLTTLSEVEEQELRASQLDHHAHLDEQARDIALARLAGILGLETASLPAEADLGWPQPSERRGYKGPEELLAVSRLKALSAEYRRLPAWPRPSLDADASWGREARKLPLEDSRLSGGLRLNAELWDGGNRSAEGKMHQLEISAMGLEVEAARLLETSLHLAFESDVRRWLEHKPHLEERMALSAKIRQKVIEEYRRGVRDGRDLSGSSMDLLEVEEEWAEDRAIAWKSWARAEALSSQKP